MLVYNTANENTPSNDSVDAYKNDNWTIFSFYKYVQFIQNVFSTKRDSVRDIYGTLTVPKG